MNTAKKYVNSDGEERTIHQMVREEPEWAANRIQEGEKAIDEVRKLKSALIKHAAFIARELHEDDITEAQDSRLYSLIQRMKADAK